jgi:hypothetical protein
MRSVTRLVMATGVLSALAIPNPITTIGLIHNDAVVADLCRIRFKLDGGL